MNYIQHGDLLIFKLDKKPNVKEKLKTPLLYQGQNHKHMLRGKFMIGKDGDSTFIHSKGAELYHDEHHALKLEEGFYQMKIVKEYSHWDEEARNVID